MTKLSREQLLEIVETDHVQCGEASAMAKMLLAAEAQGPVAWVVSFNHPDSPDSGFSATYWSLREKNHWVSLHESAGFSVDVDPLYAAPQPVAVPEGELRVVHLDVLGAACGALKRYGQAGKTLETLRRYTFGDLSNLAQPVAVPDEVPATLRDQIIDICDGVVVCDSTAQGIWKACRAAMLSAPVNPELTTQSQWIPCSERMPEAGQKVLAYRPDAPESDDPLIRMATYVGRSAHGHGFDCYCKPSHWMPLPSAPGSS